MGKAKKAKKADQDLDEDFTDPLQAPEPASEQASAAPPARSGQSAKKGKGKKAAAAEWPSDGEDAALLEPAPEPHRKSSAPSKAGSRTSQAPAYSLLEEADSNEGDGTEEGQSEHPQPAAATGFGTLQEDDDEDGAESEPTSVDEEPQVSEASSHLCLRCCLLYCSEFSGLIRYLSD